MGLCHLLTYTDRNTLLWTGTGFQQWWKPWRARHDAKAADSSLSSDAFTQAEDDMTTVSFGAPVAPE